MSITLLDSDSGNYNLYTTATVLTTTPSLNVATLCQVYVALGDGIKNLDGSGGDFGLTITVGGQTLDGAPDTRTFGSVTRAGMYSGVFAVPPNKQVIVKITSPNTADTAVGVLAYLYDVGASASSVNEQCDTALSDYDPPTKAELDSAHAATDALIAMVDGVVDAIQAVTDNLPDSGALTALLAELRIAKAGAANKVVYDSTTGETTIYDDDGTTVLVTLQLDSDDDGKTVIREPTS